MRNNSILAVILFFYSIIFSFSQQTKTVNSTLGYQVQITLDPITVIPSLPGCSNGVYNVHIPYSVSFTGTNIPASLWTLQGDIDCIGTNNIFFDLPNSGGSNTAISSNASTTNGNCPNITCSTIDVLVHGPGIDPAQTITFSVKKLSIFLSEFKVQNIHSVNLISWINSDERPLEKINVEHSADGLKWSTIHFSRLNRNDDFSFKHQYKLIDNFYRLKLIYSDSNFEYSQIIRLKSKVSKSIIFPNPGNGLFVLTETFSDKPIFIYDCANQIISMISSKQGTTLISLAHLAKGIYFLKYENEIQKIIKL